MNKKQKKIEQTLCGEVVMSRAGAVSVCKLDERSLEIISQSPMKGYRVARDHRAIKTVNVINDFFKYTHFVDKRCLEVGPGHYSFAMLARQLGSEVVAIERSPVHAMLGRHLGFQVIEDDVMSIHGTNTSKFNGILMKNVQYPGDYRPESLSGFVAMLEGLLGADGWGWVVLRNGLVKSYPEETDLKEVPELIAQRRAFEQAGWKAYPIHEDDRGRYGLKVLGAPWIFLRNLRGPRL
ncbi:hypothetical protein SAMN02745704_00161 [Paucidesulfovibrio gracilis DSM 16080]|uniref:Methyltransferase domain-containing protein n=1 Tax=Paucidesulfovibrio gracilis DSM 16080 TaxID=1121449 RepID=A0A1T4W2X5_9BACT|nr:hypothetical protein [Paucidesulfovibrio gracilis]SKA71547.1 hypothetical protein SAMN02745704_00161 [Paucidesulfovibrio gracilis DSM 16080]